MILLFSILSSAFCLVWVFLDPSFSSVAGFLASVVVLITSVCQKNSRANNQKQKVKGGVGIQAGRDVNVGVEKAGDKDARQR